MQEREAAEMDEGNTTEQSVWDDASGRGLVKKPGDPMLKPVPLKEEWRRLADMPRAS